ncbi:MAG: hypothetical protein Q4A19_01880 [Johnsonella sp.]|nr:hypothetical protein [Johnsonella sp.]
MDKYEFNIKVEQLKKLVKEKDYANAMQIADNIDWRRVHNASLLSTVSEIYERMQDYTEAKEILLLAYERVPVGKHLLYRLTKLAIKEGSIAEAEAYYNEFNEIAPHDSRAFILRYMIMKEKGAPAEQLIAILENYNRTEINEKWMYELAELYHQAGCSDDCVRICDNIMLMFGVGDYVEKAMRLKVEGEGRELNEYQQNLMASITGAGESREDAYAAPYAWENEEEEGEENQEQSDGSFAGALSPKVRENEGFKEDESEADDIEEEAFFASKTREENSEAFAEEEEQRVYRYAPDQVEEEDIFDQIRAAGEHAEEEGENAAFVQRFFKEAEEENPSYAKELEEQEKLRKELSGMRNNGFKESSEEEKTKIISSLRQAISIEEAAEEPDAPELEKQNAQEKELFDNTQKSGANQDFEGIDLIDIEDLEEENLFIITARNAAEGMEAAVARLKKIQSKRGRKSQAVRIKAGKLNTKGLAAYADKIEGRDLIIEEVGDLSADTANELLRIARNSEGESAIILIDNPLQIEIFAREHAELAQCFGYEEKNRSADLSFAAGENERENEKAKREEEIPLKQVKEEEEPFLQSREEKPQESTEKLLIKTKDADEESAEPDIKEAGAPHKIIELKERGAFLPEEGVKEPVKAIRLSGANQMREQLDAEMDLDRFGEYASDYAKSIDCVIDGKSMLALLERAEIMQTEGIALTVENARELIEEAADKAEKPPLIKRIFGFLSPKYNKEGMLILKEEHFI